MNWSPGSASRKCEKLGWETRAPGPEVERSSELSRGACGGEFSSNYFLKIVSIAQSCTTPTLISQLVPIFVQRLAWLVQFRTSILKSWKGIMEEPVWWCETERKCVLQYVLPHSVLWAYDSMSIKCNSVDFRQPPRKLRPSEDKSNFSAAIKHQTHIKILNNKGPPPTLPATTCGQSQLHSKHRPYIAETFSKIKKRKIEVTYRDYKMIKELIKSGILIHSCVQREPVGKCNKSNNWPRVLGWSAIVCFGFIWPRLVSGQSSERWSGLTFVTTLQYCSHHNTTSGMSNVKQ